MNKAVQAAVNLDGRFPEWVPARFTGSFYAYNSVGAHTAEFHIEILDTGMTAFDLIISDLNNEVIFNQTDMTFNEAMKAFLGLTAESAQELMQK